MNIKEYLLKYSKNLTINDIEKNDMSEYKYFKNFINKHYSLEHIKEHNYLKYVKIIRQKIVYETNQLYDINLEKINDIINKMYYHNVFMNININKYLFKLNKIFLLLDKKELAIKNLIKKYRLLYETYIHKKDVSLKILYNLNNITYKQQIFIKLSKILKFHIHELINLQEKYDIEHKLIEINNIERTLLGKKTEYKVEKIIKEFINLTNTNNTTNVNYIYIQNIDVIKLFHLNIKDVKNFKGELDGILLYYDGNDYIIDYFIEVKSSIKSTYEDVSKFHNLKKCIEKLNINCSFPLNNISLTKKSFKKIINNHISESIIYICIDKKIKIEKSHFYFSHVLKIIDCKFIKEYYINKDKSIIDKKYKLIKDNVNYIDSLFNKWKEDVNLNNISSSVYLIHE